VQRDINYTVKNCIPNIEQTEAIVALESALGPKRTDGSKAVTSKV